MQYTSEHVSRAEQREFPPLTWVFAPLLHRSIAPSLQVIPDSSAQRPLSAHLKFHSAPVKSLHARSNLKEGAIPDVAPIWPMTCLLFEIFYKLHLSMKDLWCRLTLEGTRESVWICACPRLMESSIRMELERNSSGLKLKIRFVNVLCRTWLLT